MAKATKVATLFFWGGEVGEAEDQQLEHCIGKEEGTLSDLDAPRNEGNILEADWIRNPVI